MFKIRKYLITSTLIKFEVRDVNLARQFGRPVIQPLDGIVPRLGLNLIFGHHLNRFIQLAKMARDTWATLCPKAGSVYIFLLYC